MDHIPFDPLEYYFDNRGFEPEKINCIVNGEKYTAVLLINGNIGVCANLKTIVEINSVIPERLDLNLQPDRIVYTAYLNAMLNYDNEYLQQLDIYEVVDFKSYKNIVMIGYFVPLVKKFDESKIHLTIFDSILEDTRLSPNDNKEKIVTLADCLIVTATTIQNNTLGDLLSRTNRNCDVFLLGPSAIMHPDLFKETNIKIIFGTIFEKNDKRILDLIKNGSGTREFIKFGKKVVFNKTL